MRAESRRAFFLSVILLLAIDDARSEGLMPPGFDEVLLSARDAFEHIHSATEQLRATLAQCTALVQGQTDSPRTTYRDLEKSVPELESLSIDLQSAVKRMDDRANKFFKKWEDSFEGMSAVDRDSSEQLRNDVWGRYRKIADDGAKSEVDLRPVVEDLKALLEVIDDEVDTGSMKSHQSDLDKLNAKAKTWLKDARKRYDDAEKELRALEKP